MSGFLSPEEKSNLHNEASAIFKHSKLTEEESLVMGMYTGASEGYRMNVEEIAAVFRKTQEGVMAIILAAEAKIGESNTQRLKEIDALLTEDFPGRE